MCVPGCMRHVHDRLLSRRLLLGGGAALAGAMALPPVTAQAANLRSFSRVVDLTHTLVPDFPTYFGKPQLQIEATSTLAAQGFNENRWTLMEHTGTHMDAPFHFSADGDTADEIPVERLVVPLAVVDIAQRAQTNPDAQVTPDDIKAYEAAHGPIPAGACVAMRSGWDRHVASAMFRNPDDKGVMHFPGFHPEATALLAGEREVVGIAVDTLSLDYGASTDFAVHYSWLPSGRWGLECVANLAELPPAGATLVAGGPKVLGASGGPSRVLALL